MCDLDEKCEEYSLVAGCDDFNNISDGEPVCFKEKTLTNQQTPVAKLPCNVGLATKLANATEIIKELAERERECKCQNSDIDIRKNRHFAGCLVGKAQRFLGIVVSFPNRKGVWER